MLLAPARPNLQRRPTVRTYSMPSPVGGLNARESITDMPPEDALVLDNWFPQPDYAEVRRGHESHATGIGAAVLSLMAWEGPGATRKLFAAKSTDIYDVSSSGAVGAADVSSLTNGKWQHTMMATSAGNFLIICNGDDAVRSFDGSSWASPSITGVSSADLINCYQHIRRLWFVEKNTTSAWYLATEAISGAATEFDLGPQFRKGGQLVAIGSLTRDGGNGPDDAICFVSSRGEVAVYSGTDPSDSTAFSLVGVFEVSPPIGHRCLQKVGADLALITDGGVVSLSAMLALDRSAQERAAVTSKINRVVMEDARSHRANFGWQVISYPRNNMFLVNVPVTESSSQRQYVMNTLTGGWCRFTGMNANCWALFNDDLYFGGNSDEVYKADSSFQDDGAAITADIKTAFSYYGARGRLKQFKQVRPHFETNGTPSFLMDLNVDFADVAPTSTPTAIGIGTAFWGSGLWGTATWGTGTEYVSRWQGITGLGTSAALRLRVQTNGASVKLHGFDVMAEVGAPQ